MCVWTREWQIINISKRIVRRKFYLLLAFKIDFFLFHIKTDYSTIVCEHWAPDVKCIVPLFCHVHKKTNDFYREYKWMYLKSKYFCDQFEKKRKNSSIFWQIKFPYYLIFASPSKENIPIPIDFIFHFLFSQFGVLQNDTTTF